MKKITKKQVVSAFENVICVPYCAVQYLFPRWERHYYTAGIYGWNADVHIIDPFSCIVTGYRAFGNVHPSAGLCQKYDDLAKIDPKLIPDLREEFAREALRLNKG